jgi:L-alanine-DL-glutamate epimerase-like enolase superfamily enzyme
VALAVASRLPTVSVSQHLAWRRWSSEGRRAPHRCNALSCLDAVGERLRRCPYYRSFDGESRVWHMILSISSSSLDHGSVGWSSDHAEVVENAREQAQIFRSLELYAGRGSVDQNLDGLQAVRDAVGPDWGLFVDVNGLWTPSDLVRALPRVREIGLAMLDQPLPPSSTVSVTRLVDRVAGQRRALQGRPRPQDRRA